MFLFTSVLINGLTVEFNAISNKLTQSTSIIEIQTNTNGSFTSSQLTQIYSTFSFFGIESLDSVAQKTSSNSTQPLKLPFKFVFYQHTMSNLNILNSTISVPLFIFNSTTLRYPNVNGSKMMADLNTFEFLNSQTQSNQSQINFNLGASYINKSMELVNGGNLPFLGFYLTTSTQNRIFNSVLLTKQFGSEVNSADIKRLISSLKKVPGLEVVTDVSLNNYLSNSNAQLILVLNLFLVMILSLIVISSVNVSYLLLSESLPEIKILKDLGFSRFQRVNIFLFQFVLTAILGGITASILSVAMFQLIFSGLGIISETIYISPIINVEGLILPIIGSVIVVLFGSLISLIIIQYNTGEIF